MIKTLFFDFGDVFINLNKQKPLDEFRALGFEDFSEDIIKHNKAYEVGQISTKEFIQLYQKKALKEISESAIKNAWNSMLIDFPKRRLKFIKELASVKNFNLILLSNTNALHMNWIKKHIPFYLDFKLCFQKFYLSQDIHLRKPEIEVYEFILKENDIKPEEILFIDDTKANTDSAKTLGFKVWNIDPKTEDVIDLFSANQHLF